jgi:hypothetical protein
MINSQVPNFSDFVSLNESKSISKKNLGIIGPLANWSMKLQVYPEPNQGMIGYALDENWVEIFHKDKKIKFPKSCCEMKSNSKSAVIHIKPHTKWFSKLKNREEMEDFVDNFLESHTTKIYKDQERIAENTQIILDLFGIHSNVQDSKSKFTGLYEFKLDNGMEVEIEKPDESFLFSDLKIYKSPEAKFPDVRIKRKEDHYLMEFRGPAGKFSESEETLTDLFENKICSYLSKCVLEMDCSLEESYLISRLKDMISEKVDSKNSEKLEKRKTQIQNLRSILANSIEQTQLEEILQNRN